VLGQPNFTCSVFNDDGLCNEGSPSANNLADPSGIIQIGNQLIVTDENGRLLIYNGM